MDEFRTIKLSSEFFFSFFFSNENLKNDVKNQIVSSSNKKIWLSWKSKDIIFVYLISSEGLEIFNTFPFEVLESRWSAKIFWRIFYPLPERRIRNICFFSCVQAEEQAIEWQLKTSALVCEFLITKMGWYVV